MASKSRNVTPPTTRPAAPRTTSPAAATDKSSLNPTKSPGRAELNADQIRDRAYFLWEEAGRPDGDGVQFWLAAELELTCR